MKLTKKQNIKLSIIITFITMILSMVVHFFYTPFLLNNIGDSQYGLYGFATSVLSWLSVAVNAILSAYNKITSEEVAKDKENGEKRINTIYSFIVVVWSAIISIVASVALLLMSFGIISLDNYSPSDQHTILILLIVISIQMVTTIATRVSTLNITYNDHHVWVKLSTLIVTILAPIISIPFIVYGCNIITIVIIQSAVNVASNLLDLFFDHVLLQKKYFCIPKKNDFKMLLPIFSFCSIILINEIAYQFDCSIDGLVLGAKGYSAEITLYTLALTIVTIASTCSSMIYTPFIPTVFKNESQGKRAENLALYNQITFGQTILWLFITGGFIACGRYFVRIWVGEEREVVYYICASLFLIRSVSNCAGPSKDMMRANNKHLHRAILAVCVTVLNVLLTIILVNMLPREQAIWGCIVGTGVSSLAGWWIAANIMSYKFLKIDLRSFAINFAIVFLLMTASDIVCISLNAFVLSNITTSNIILFLVSGSIYVLLFILLLLLVYKLKIKELYKLFRSK